MGLKQLEIGKYYVTKCGRVGQVVKDLYSGNYSIQSNIPTAVTDEFIKSVNPYVLWNSTGSATNAVSDDQLYTVVKEVTKEENPEYFL